MPAPRSVSQWPTAGERRTRCTLQYSTPTTDGMGGRTEPTWTDFGIWQAKVLTAPDISNETDSVILYQIEGPYRADVEDYFKGRIGMRVMAMGQTLKVFQVENPLLVNRTLIVHCAPARSTQ